MDTSTPRSKSGRRTSAWTKVRLSIFAVALVLGLVLIFLNDQEVVTHLIFWQPRAPLFMILGLVFFFGFLGGFFLGRQTRS